MTDKSLDEVRRSVVEMRANLEATHIAIELSADKDDPAFVQAKARALRELQRALEGIELLADELGGVPAPVRH